MGQWKKYFPVTVGSTTRDVDAVGVTRECHTRQGQAYLSQLFGSFEKATQEKRRNGPRHRFEANPWLEHTGWEGHIGQYKSTIVQMIQPDIHPNQEGETPSKGEEGESEEAKSERALRHACEATQLLIRRSFRICRPEIVNRSALEYVNRREVGVLSSNRPFYGKQNVKTLRKYSDR